MSTQHLPLPQQLAQLLLQDFDRYNAAFRELTRATAAAFERRDWQQQSVIASSRIDLYEKFVAQTINELGQSGSFELTDVRLWSEARQHYAISIQDRVDRGFCETFFNSVNRQLFRTVGVNRSTEFASHENSPIDHFSTEPELATVNLAQGAHATADELLSQCDIQVAWRDKDACVEYLCNELDRAIPAGAETLEILAQIFYRTTRAFQIGRLRDGADSIPLIVAYMHHPDGLAVDAVLIGEDAASILFSFSRSYFHVDLATVSDTVRFLAGLMPAKPLEELYAVLGRAKQAKTERVRSMFRHLESSDDQFLIAPGVKGMVMAAFVLPELELVFKVIRDEFAKPKTVTRADVLARYELVFHHDRAGRLIDAQEYRQLQIPRARIDQAVMTDLLETCANSVSLDGQHLVLHHVYTERMITPLNLYLSQCDDAQARAVVDDYGQALRDLARSNIFPGDLLLKNFGVTRHGRVIFYDYDELCLLQECRFRALPKARDDFDEFSEQPWFHVAPEDVFPEQFVNFMGLNAEQLEWFRERHSDVLTPEYWRSLQARTAAGERVDFAPYPNSRSGL